MRYRKMVARFYEIFEEVMEQVGAEEWYELFDSAEFGLVESRIVAEFGEEVLESEEYEGWVEEMAWDL